MRLLITINGPGNAVPNTFSYLVLVQKTFYSSIPTLGPLIQDAITVIPKALYQLEVYILETDFGSKDEFVNVTIDGESIGICRPTTEGLCRWHSCSKLNVTDVRFNHDRIPLQFQYSIDVDSTRASCDERPNQVGARVSFNLEGKE